MAKQAQAHSVCMHARQNRPSHRHIGLVLNPVVMTYTDKGLSEIEKLTTYCYVFIRI